MSINSILFSQGLLTREPALLNVGSRQNNYESLETYLQQDDKLTSPAASSSSTVSDTVDLALDRVAAKIVTELAGLTAGTISDYPEFRDDYVLTIIDSGDGSREARVYSREEIVESSGGTPEEKLALRQSLDGNPLAVFPSASGLPESSESPAAQDLTKKVNSFLTTNEKLLDLLDAYGFNPFEELKL
ncbi:MAG: hypothetical protein LBG06_06665 [Deltaproteobacteria bacterium]|nr:hypothetical protein [Deltaproteobacteria bacterium]